VSRDSTSRSAPEFGVEQEKSVQIVEATTEEIGVEALALHKRFSTAIAKSNSRVECGNVGGGGF
jgi:hypothetical protein